MNMNESGTEFCSDENISAPTKIEMILMFCRDTANTKQNFPLVSAYCILAYEERKFFYISLKNSMPSF